MKPHLTSKQRGYLNHIENHYLPFLERKVGSYAERDRKALLWMLGVVKEYYQIVEGTDETS